MSEEKAFYNTIYCYRTVDGKKLSRRVDGSFRLQSDETPEEKHRLQSWYICQMTQNQRAILLFLMMGWRVSVSNQSILEDSALNRWESIYSSYLALELDTDRFFSLFNDLLIQVENYMERTKV